MIERRPFESLGSTEFHQLRARHHFCFAHYQDAGRLSWGRLRAVNHNRLPAGAAVPRQYHHDMDILMLVERGGLSVHGGGRDHLVAPGETLLISAGVGIEFSIENRARADTDYVEIWTLPGNPGGEPSITRHALPSGHGPMPIASGRAGNIGVPPLRGNTRISRVELIGGERRSIPLRAEDHVYAVVLEGRVEAADLVLQRHDGLALRDVSSLEVAARGASELILIETD